MFARALPFILVLSFTAGTAAGQMPSTSGTQSDEPPGTGVIVGQVIDPGSGSGVPGAIVSIAGPPQPRFSRIHQRRSRPQIPRR